MDDSKKSSWTVIESIPIRELINQNTYQLPDGNYKKIGGDIHFTVDDNPESKTFGEVHSTVKIPGYKKLHY